MAADSKTNGMFDPIMQPFVDLWSDYFKQANDVTRVFLDGIDDSIDLKAWQRRCLDSVSKSLDAYMRSPAFLQAMKHNMDSINHAKQRFDDVATEIARNANIPTANDISGLFERLHCRCDEKHIHTAGHNNDHMGQQIRIDEELLSRLGRIEERLQKIEKQICSQS